MKFLRRTWNRYSKLGKGRKKKQVWRKPKGRDNKMREKRKGYPKVVSIGYGNKKKKVGLINDKKKVIVRNLGDLEKIKKNEIVIIGSIGERKRLEIVKRAKENKIEIYNLNIKKFMKKIDNKKKKPSTKKVKKEEKKNPEKEIKKDTKK